MSSEPVTAFAGRILADDFDQLEPVEAQIQLDADQLDITAGQARYTIPLDTIHDTTVGSVTAAIEEAFPESLAVAYTAEETQKRVVIGGTEDDISSFRTRLFTSIIGTQPALLKHPAKRGGRLTDTETVKMQLQLSDTAVRLSDGDRALTIDVEDVIGVEHEHREFRDTRRPTLAVDHTPDDATVTTFLTLPEKQDLTLLSQFIQLNYSQVTDDVSELELSMTETQALVALYSAGGNAPLEMILTGEDSEQAELLQTLEDQNLVIKEGEDLQLTSRGEVAVTEEIEAVNQ
jgi:helix-turn-helix protein